jgi:hypothetical protein
MVQFLTWAREFSPLQSVQTGSGTNPASYAVGSRWGVPFPEVRQLGHETEDSFPSSVEFKTAWSHTSTLLHTFMTVAINHSHKFTLLFHKNLKRNYIILPKKHLVVDCMSDIYLSKRCFEYKFCKRN